MGNYHLFTRQVDITRPANTTAYAVGDVITETPPVPFVVFMPNLRRTECVYLTRAFLCTNKSAHIEALRLWLFSKEPPTLPADNAPYPLTIDPEGYVDFTTWVTGGAGSTVACSEGLYNVPTQMEIKGGTFWGVLEARAIFTPTSGQTFEIEFCVEVPDA